jgi:predicted O-methyltransferase YrrM
VSLKAFRSELRAVEADLLEEVWAEGRNPRNTSDGHHFVLPGTPRPVTVSRTEARFLANFVAMLNTSTVLEIGTGFGYSTAWLGYGVSLSRPEGRVYTVDDFSEGERATSHSGTAEEIWKRTGTSAFIRQILGTSPGDVDAQSPMLAGLAFIDGEHRGSQPLLDYRAAKRHLAPEGCILFHDVQDKYTVRQAVAAAESDGFKTFPLNTSCEPVLAVRTSAQLTLANCALDLSTRGLVLSPWST